MTIQQYNKNLTFSNTYKHTNCQVTQGGKLVAEVANSHYCFCVCEQPIPKAGKIQFTFQILTGSDFFVGIGFKDIMQQKNYYDCNNSGTYLIKENGPTQSHDNKDIHDKQLSLDKYIKWSKQNNPQKTFAKQWIDTSQQLYPCVGLGRKAQIKILN
ncbi:unnamed protein product [Paramecium sonneborni]|uniref:Uncharacterized protein n=1 Tax=Paramecium sonneborni TaxID=65129 RepID=A0A8S1RL46_9CILI|nr:unnamed protein product [Paramecium sonneborni]